MMLEEKTIEADFVPLIEQHWTKNKENHTKFKLKI